MILLKVQHGFKNLAVAPRNQTHSSQDLQDGYLGLDVLSRQRLGDCVDCCRVRQNMSPAVLELVMIIIIKTVMNVDPRD